MAEAAGAKPEEVYVAGLFVHAQDDDVMRLALDVRVNTDSRVRSVLTGGLDGAARPDDEHEARWNHAWWSVQALVPVLGVTDDAEGAAARAAWLKNADVSNDARKAFLALLVGLVQGLHADSVPLALFGREVPVVLHDAEDVLLEPTQAGNPRELLHWLEPHSG